MEEVVAASVLSNPKVIIGIVTCALVTIASCCGSCFLLYDYETTQTSITYWAVPAVSLILAFLSCVVGGFLFR